MMTEDQAKAASDALFGHAKAAQRADRLSLERKRKRRSMPSIKWMAICATIGLIVGSTAEYLVVGTISFWSVLGLAIGSAIGVAIDSRVEA